MENFAAGTGFGVADARLDEVAGIFAVNVWEGREGPDWCPACVGAGERPEEIHSEGVMVKLDGELRYSTAGTNTWGWCGVVLCQLQLHLHHFINLNFDITLSIIKNGTSSV